MERLQFKTVIDAPRSKVWNILWDDDTYRKWTSVFSADSHAVTDWKKGSKVLFLDGKGSGMVSTVAENIPNEYMSIKHLGEVRDGVEDTTSERVKKWGAGDAQENYTLKDVDGKTELTIDLDMSEEFKDYFVDAFPKALDKVKELAESN